MSPYNTLNTCSQISDWALAEQSRLWLPGPPESSRSPGAQNGGQAKSAASALRKDPDLFSTGAIATRSRQSADVFVCLAPCCGNRDLLRLSALVH